MNVRKSFFIGLWGGIILNALYLVFTLIAFAGAALNCWFWFSAFVSSIGMGGLLALVSFSNGRSKQSKNGWIYLILVWIAFVLFLLITSFLVTTFTNKLFDLNRFVELTCGSLAVLLVMLIYKLYK